MMLLWGTTAAAAALVGGLSADGSVQSPSRHLGVGGMLGAQLAPAWSLEAAVEGRASWEDAARLASRAEVRWAFPGASALVGGGAAWIPGGGVAPQLSAGLAVDTGGGWRTQARYLYTLQDEPAVLLSVGRVWPRPSSGGDVVEPVVVDTTTQATQATQATQPHPDLAERLGEMEGVKIWLPHPICEWVPASDAADFLSTLSPDQQLRLRAAGYLPTTTRLGDDTPIEMQPVPPQGSLVVAAGAGDVASLVHEASPDPVAVSLNADGNGIVTLPQGAYTLTVVGAGREYSQQGVVTDGNAIWYPVPLPEETVVRFASNSSRLSAAARQEVARILEHPGNWVYQVWGSASPEGSRERNLQLASERAQAVATALIDGGLPEEQVVALPPSELHPTGTAAEQRAAHIIPTRGAP